MRREIDLFEEYHHNDSTIPFARAIEILEAIKEKIERYLSFSAGDHHYNLDEDTGLYYYGLEKKRANSCFIHRIYRP